MSVWSWLKGAFQPPPAPPPVRPIEAPPSDETFLRSLLATVPEPSGPSLAVAGPRLPLGNEVFLALDRLAESGREETTLELLRQLSDAFPREARLRVRLSELLCERLDHEVARPLLERLTELSEHAARAHFLLGEGAERRGDLASARRHFETILSVQLDYPQARRRADRLRPEEVRPSAPPPTATLTGLPEGGAPLAGYRLIREIGRGASGAVYLAFDESLEREVALKLLHPKAHAGTQAEARTRAWLEARMVAAIRHPGVVTLFELDEGRHFYVMELCRGGALGARLARGPLPVSEALGRAIELVTTLEAVHRKGVVHGDLKPANLLFRNENQDSDLVLGDFGIARLSHDSQPAIEQRAGRGTLAYMAPEQRWGHIEPASDLYAVGVLLVELLSGRTALSSWLDDRAGLLVGQARWDGRFPSEVERALGDRREPMVALARSLMVERAEERPRPRDVVATLAALTALR